jgi:hypothetical protein
MNKLTVWLKNNEVYFTTICTILLSGMAVIVSIISYKVSSNQYEMEYFEKQPDFQITKKQILNNKTQKYDDTELIITKLSGKAKNIEVQTINWLEVNYTNKLNESKVVRFLIVGYYDSSFLTGQTDGVIQTEAGYKNNSSAIKLENYIDEIIKNQNQYGYSQLKSYVEIKYLNFENEPKTEYFDASFSSGKLITNDTLSKYFNQESKLFDFSNTINLREIDNTEKLHKLLSIIK